MAIGTGAGPHEEAVLDGGPLDGSRQAIDAGTSQLCVVMTDGQQHQYIRSDESRTSEDGHPVPVFTWNGRYYGPK